MTSQKRTRRHPHRLRGRIAVHVRGFGFVDFDEGEAPVDSAFVAPPDLNPFLAGDLVEVTLEASDDERYRAFDLELVERLRREVIGRVESSGGRFALRLDARIGNTSWSLSGAPKKLRNGSTVIAEPVNGETVVRFLRTVPDRDAGRATVLVYHRIRTELDAAVLAEAKGFRFSRKGRRDLSEVPTLTIDAAVSKDLDDALAVLPPQEDGALRILVSIADVDTAVPAGSKLDLEARQRATSVYLPDLVVPMLPPELSEQGLSLLEGAERPALTVELRIDTEGEVTATDISTSVIRSWARLTYTDVAAYLDRGKAGPIPEEVREPLLWLRTAASRLAAVRAARGGVVIEPDEVTVDVDRSSGEPKGVSVREATSAHLLVERLMVATNEAVAGWLIDRGLPALFRVQDELEEEQIERLAEFAANFGFRTAFGGQLSPRGMAAFEEQFRSSTMAPSIRSVLRWFLGRARYQATPSPHYALATPAYLHFTSPIRRYPDLVVHRVIKAHLEGKRRLLLEPEELDEIAAGVNDAARRAEKAETDRLRMLVARLFASRVGEEHPAHIVAAKPFGLVVRLDDLGVMGTIATEALGPGRWELDKATYSLASNQRRYMIGEAVEVRVASTDEELGRLDLELSRQP